ncbi:hypothetical protein P171DRAFT_452386 [Karstenula rhodostoma CBS 690.94]|uniref:PSI domain-containing protein n=1 Tax=Karstenula rhodostoma CBS 690.94 TaxID=1392251 RepID=A0A9P4PNX2_9PLEO|nr:hypothetical protein P171DRAFT_452386 [Karstenula rhodostoma CBS 690.94]
MASNCPAISRSSSHTPYNVTEIRLQRWEDSPRDNRKRLELCWGYNDCGDCHRSKGHCGWCAISSTCLPLPIDPLSRAFPLLSPIRYKFLCATGPERFELRTSGLGCQVSTITFLTSIVTLFCTLFGVLFIYLVVYAAKRINFMLNAKKGGWVVYADGRGGIWVRKSKRWERWWRRTIGRLREDEILEVDGGTRERSWWAWIRGSVHREGRIAIGESRPLLS